MKCFLFIILHMKRIIYVAGPLFTEYEMKQRREEGKLIRKLMDSLNLEYEIGNPIDFGITPNDEIKGQPEPKVIFETDAKFIDKTNVFFFDLANNDTGTHVEIGMAIQKLRAGEKVSIYPVHSDFRTTSNSRLGFHSTIGFNAFAIGAFEQYGIKIYHSFNEALEVFTDIKEEYGNIRFSIDMYSDESYNSGVEVGISAKKELNESDYKNSFANSSILN